MLKMFRMCCCNNMDNVVEDPRREMLAEVRSYLHFLERDHHEEMMNLFGEMKRRMMNIKKKHAKELQRKEAAMRDVLLKKEAEILELRQQLAEYKDQLLNLKADQNRMRNPDFDHQAMNVKEEENRGEESGPAQAIGSLQKVFSDSETTLRAEESEMKETEPEVSSLHVIIKETPKKATLEKSFAEQIEPKEELKADSNTCASGRVDVMEKAKSIRTPNSSSKEKFQRKPLNHKIGVSASFGVDKRMTTLSNESPKSSIMKRKPKEHHEIKSRICASGTVKDLEGKFPTDMKTINEQEETHVLSTKHKKVSKPAYAKVTLKEVPKEESLLRRAERQKCNTYIEQFLEAKRMKEQLKLQAEEKKEN